jgi:hypothetical protein
MSEDLKAKDEAGPEATRKMKDDDTQGHRKFTDDGEDQGGPEGARRHLDLNTPDGSEDTEGHRK